MKKAHPTYAENVFINCPFDDHYVGLFQAMVFTIHCLGLRPRCALEAVAAENRIDKIVRIISESKYGIHDISRTELDEEHGLPRFNMPFELGLDLGCKAFNGEYKDKKHLMLDTEKYRYQKFLSDLSGFDPRPHSNKVGEVIQIVSDWIRSDLEQPQLPNGRQINNAFMIFETDFVAIRGGLPDNPSFPDFSYVVAKWVEEYIKSSNS